MENATVRIGELPPPGAADDPIVDAAIGKLRDLVAERDQAWQRLGELKNRRPAAMAADRGSVAEWIRKGRQGRDPGDKALGELDAKIQAATREHAGLGEAVVQEAAELERVLAVEGPRLHAALDQKAASLHGDYVGGLRAARDSVDGIEKLMAFASWLGRGVTREGKNSPYRSRVHPSREPLEGLLGAEGAPELEGVEAR